MTTIQNIIKEIQNKDIIEIILSIVILVVFFLFSSVFARAISKVFKVKRVKLKENPIYKMLKLIFIITGVYLSVLFLQLPNDFMNIFNRITKIVMIILLTRLIADCINPQMSIIKKIIKDDVKGESSINFITKIIRVLIYIIGTFIIISELGYDLSGIITGLGLSGVVIALAAQDIAKNLFAGFAVLTDKTFVVGDYIETEKFSGNIEDISFRSTRIRTTDNSLITVPNSILSDGQVINWSKNCKRRYEFNLRFKLDSNITTLKEISNRIRFVLKTNKDIIQDSINVNFTQILEDSINLNIYFYTPIVEYSEFLEFKSEINIMILAMLEKERIQLAYPTQSVVTSGKY